MITTVGLQYAKALFDLASAKNLEKSYYDNLVVINDVVKKNEEVLKTFSHPSITNEEKKDILSNTLKGNIEDELLHFLFVLIDNNRFLELGDIIDSYQKYLNELNKECNAIIYTKYMLLEEEKKNLINKLEKHFNKKVNANIIVDETLIGGITINIDGKVIDASIYNQMLSLKNELKKGW